MDGYSTALWLTSISQSGFAETGTPVSTQAAIALGIIYTAVIVMLGLCFGARARDAAVLTAILALCWLGMEQLPKEVLSYLAVAILGSVLLSPLLLFGGRANMLVRGASVGLFGAVFPLFKAGFVVPAIVVAVLVAVGVVMSESEWLLKKAGARRAA